MKVKEIQRVVFLTNNRDESVSFWTDLLGLDFPPRSHDPVELRKKLGKITHTYSEWATERDKSTPIAAVSTIGVEIMQKEPLPVEEGVMWLVLTVDDIEQAKAEMAAKGIRWVHEIRTESGGGEVFYHPDDLHGVSLVLCQSRNRSV